VRSNSTPLRCLLSDRCHHAFCHCTDDVTTLACLSGVYSLTVATINHTTTRRYVGGGGNQSPHYSRAYVGGDGPQQQPGFVREYVL
jgi:hypothetical protein